MQTDWEKRAQELLPLGLLTERSIRDAALQLGREMADARAEEIANEVTSAKPLCDQDSEHTRGWKAGMANAGKIARSTISKPKTRERVLEEALLEIVDGQTWTISAATAVARRALNWKPPT